LQDIEPDVGLAVGEEGEVMILSLQREDAYGGNDLYVSLKMGENHWGPPIHLGPAVNSPYREITPFLSSDGRTLFFSSNRKGGRGGGDLYMVFRLDDTWQNWTAPMKFVSPINSHYNESQPQFIRSTGYLYFTSNRDGSNDIYRVKIAPPVSDEVTVVGNVLNASETKLENATVLLRSTQSGIYQNTYISTDGHYEISVPKGESFQLLARKPGFQSDRKLISFEKSDIYFKAQHINIALQPLEVGGKINLNTIYFKQSTPIILSESYAELEYLAEIMSENKGLVISIEGHTDNQGSNAALQTLSEKRAAVIRHYLVRKKRIAGNRILTKGYGATVPLNDNSTEQLRKANRRVEIKVVKMDKDFLKSTTISSMK